MHLGDGRSFFLKNSWPQLGEELRTWAAPLNSISQEEDDEAKWATDKQGDPSIDSSSSPHFFFLPSSTPSPALACFIHNIKQDSELSIGSSLNRMITNHLLPDPWKTVAVGLHWLGDSPEGEQAGALTPEGEVWQAVKIGARRVSL